MAFFHSTEGTMLPPTKGHFTCCSLYQEHSFQPQPTSLHSSNPSWEAERHPLFTQTRSGCPSKAFTAPWPFFFFFFFFDRSSSYAAWGSLVLPPGIKLRATAVKSLTPNYWTTGNSLPWPFYSITLITINSYISSFLFIWLIKMLTILFSGSITYPSIW